MSEFTESLDKLIEVNYEDLCKFEEWISTQPHIPNNIYRSVLLRYMKTCDNDLEKAKKLLDLNAKFRIKNQYLFTDRDPDADEFKRSMNTIQFTPFPKLTKEGYSLESYRLVNSNVNDFILKDLFKNIYMINDMNDAFDPVTNGLISIYDATGFTLRHFLKLVAHAPTVLHFLHYGQEATCCSLKQIHLVNCSSIASRVISFFKPFFTKEVRESMHFHTNLETLHEFISKDCLPIEYGGVNGTLAEYVENVVEDLHKHRDFIGNNDNFFLVDE
ncbi:alpha-tocopherol transfer protein-like [Chironomus tepperi]|uniref:alpha-tocopherol transfer protein-like n=1 Tax=Chironomus tepperi TaxID=113505 RepID=UPI00391FC324